MRTLALALALALALLAGCLEDEPVPPPAAEPEEACEARGLVGGSCSVFCEMNAATCGLPEPPAVPYPTILPPTPSGVPPINGTIPTPTLPVGCEALPEGCPQL